VPAPLPLDLPAAIADGSGSRLAHHLTIVVIVKVVALAFLWALFFRAAA
jgi:hypothetical protein